jgi:hypothetical protein
MRRVRNRATKVAATSQSFRHVRRRKLFHFCNQTGWLVSIVAQLVIAHGRNTTHVGCSSMGCQRRYLSDVVSTPCLPCVPRSQLRNLQGYIQMVGETTPVKCGDDGSVRAGNERAAVANTRLAGTALRLARLPPSGAEQPCGQLLELKEGVTMGQRLSCTLPG